METKHTKGDWLISQITKTGPINIVDEGGKDICYMPTNSLHAPFNAKLIAAAPELLNQLIKAMEIIESEYGITGAIKDFGYKEMLDAVKEATE